MTRAVLLLLLVLGLLSLVQPGQGIITGFSSNETLVGTGVTASFERVPHLYLNFFGSDGSILPVNESYVWGGMYEVDNSSGSAVYGNSLSQLDLVQGMNLSDSSLVWTESVSFPFDASGNQYKSITYTTTFTSGAKVQISYFHYPQAHTVNYYYINTVRTLPPDSFKISLNISNWQPKNMSNLFLVQLNSFANPYFYNLVHSLNGYIYTINFQVGTDVINQTLHIVEAALAGTQVANVTWYANYVGVILTPFLAVQTFQNFYFFPNFKGTFYYDPDFSVIVGGDTNVEGSGDGSLSSTGTILLAVLVPVFVFGALVGVIIAIGVVFLVMWQKRWGIKQRLNHVQDVSGSHDSSKDAVPA